MAERRMMAKSVIEADSFMDLPMSTQCLYFHMLLRADDDGFIKNPSAIRRAIGCSSDDMTLLVAKRFILPFESGVIVIRHWKIHNYIQKDRYRPSDCEELRQIEVDAKKAYKIKDSEALDTTCIQNVSRVYPTCIQSVSIGKDRLGKSIYAAAADARARARKPDSQNRDEKISADEMHAVASAASDEQAAVSAEKEQAVAPPAGAYAVAPMLTGTCAAASHDDEAHAATPLTQDKASPDREAVLGGDTPKRREHAVALATTDDAGLDENAVSQEPMPNAEAYAVTPEHSAEGDAVPSEMAGSKAKNRELGEVVKAFCDNLQPGAGPMVLEQVADAYGTYGATWCLAAIREAAESGGRSIQYVCRILERWRRDGFKTGKGGKACGKAGKHSGTDGGTSRCDDFDVPNRKHVYPWDIQPAGGGAGSES